jgi:hypothetical protein
MTIDERARHELFIAAEKVLGSHQSETLMEMLPPVGWADVATKHDLAQLEERMSLRFDMVDQRFDMVDQRFEMVDQRFETLTHQLLGELERRLNAQTRTLFLALAGLLISLTTLLLALR